jgi:phosphatidylglycerophosphate synthase
MVPSPGAAIQNARAGAADIQTFCGFARRDTIAIGLSDSFRAAHPHDRMGAANYVTAVRAALVVGIAVLLAWPPSRFVAVAVAATASIVAVLDGVDGWLARRLKTASAFGARFDMEVDAALILALAAFAWRADKAGAWILVSGLLRYGFVAAGALWPWMRRPLAPTRRAKIVCVVQVLALVAVALPIVVRPLSSAIGAAALALLVYSFGADVIRLAETRNAGPIDPRPRIWGRAAAAAVVLNASVSFDNIWPTPLVWWMWRWSVEWAAVLLALALLSTGRRRLPRRALALLGAAWLLLVLGRYVEVTAPALYGREINLYWDLRFVPDVAAMVVRVAPRWLTIAVVALAAAVVALMYRTSRWAFGCVEAAMRDAGPRRGFAAVAILALAVFGVEEMRASPSEQRLTSTPVAQTYAHQMALVREARSGSRSLPPSPPITSAFDQIRGADVFLVFVESYGAVTEAPGFASALAPARRRLDADIRETGRQVVSAYVESPTFGGSSWLAHLSLISGIEVRDPYTNALLMTQPRDTLVKAFSRGGFRTVGLMPGLRQQWPEGRFYGFDEIYGADRLAYSGPEFGWFALPDQFSLARFDELERGRTDRPRFVFFPTISTHFPFSPTPPYQPAWARMLTPHPYDGPEIVSAYAGEPDWTDFAPGYIRAIGYDLAVLGGYLREHANRDVVMILIGDHQPPAAVSGEHATWNVPVHVIASRPAVLERLRAAGFADGLEPPAPAVTRMHALQPILLKAF